jgi:hypothetical protein
MGGNDPLLGCYRTCKALQGPEDAFLQFKGASSIHMQTFHSSNKKTFWGGGTMTPKLRKSHGNKRFPYTKSHYGAFRHFLNFYFLPKKSSIHSITTTSLLDMPSIEYTICTSKWLLGYSNATALRLLHSHLDT